MDILISNSSPVALYEQIENQIKNQILNGNLKPGDPLPSIRSFVSSSNSERLREAAMAEMEDKLEAVIISAKSLGLTLDECIEIFKSIYEEV